MANTPTTTTDQCAVLIIAPSPDEVLIQLGQSLSNTGASVHFTTDVYMAMARLATGERFAHVVVEAAALDDYETTFLSLAPQYYETSEFYVPARSVLDSRMLAHGRYEILAPDGIVDAVLGIRDAETLEAAAEAESTWTQPRTIGDQEADVSSAAVEATNDATAPPRLSTDGGVGEQDGPSLHDAVRQRMGADNGATTQRRRPPGSTEPPAESPQPASDVRVSREEMDALLQEDDDETLDDMTNATRNDGKDDA